MKNLRTYVNEHKKLFAIIGLIFIICLECCVFPVGNFAYGGNAFSRNQSGEALEYDQTNHSADN